MIVDWLTREERRSIGRTHRQRFKALIEKTGLVQEHPLVKDFRFIKGSELAALPRLPDWRDISTKLVPCSQIKAHRHFLSHRWLSPTNPDPDGRQLDILRKHLEPNHYYWVDFSCLPQKPRSPQEESMFRENIRLLPSLMFDMDFIILRCVDDGYFERAWCFFELLSAHVLGANVSWVYEDPSLGAGTHADEQRVLERTLLNQSLPSDLAATDPADMEAIQEATKTVATFSLINLVSHYLMLGQILSDNTYFFLEDRYYFMATCDFRKMLLWVFETSRELGFSLIDLSRKENTENLFMHMAEKRQFHHDADVYALPKEITLDEARQRWLSEHKQNGDSATNLFLLLSSMVRPAVPSSELQSAASPETLAPEPLKSDDSSSEATSQQTQTPNPEQISFQKWRHPDRFSIELDCPPGDPRPPEVFAMTIAKTGLGADDFEDSGHLGFGRREYLVKAEMSAITRYLEARPTIKARLTEYYNRGIIRAATW